MTCTECHADLPNNYRNVVAMWEVGRGRECICKPCFEKMDPLAFQFMVSSIIDLVNEQNGDEKNIDRGN